jgi:hypothetical protein
MQKEDKPNTDGHNGQIGHSIPDGDLDKRKNIETGSDSKNKVWTSSSVRIEHQPPKLGVEGSNPSSPAIFLVKWVTIDLWQTRWALFLSCL